MAKLTKYQHRQILDVQRALEAAFQYLDDPHLHVVKPCSITMGRESTFVRVSDDAVFGSVTKFMGSDLARLPAALQGLRDFLAAHGNP